MSDGLGADVLDSAAAGPAAMRGAALRTGGYALGSLVSLGSVALLFRHLGVDDSGRYLTVQSLVAVAAGISDAGITVIGTREYAVLDGDARLQMLRDLLGLRIVLTALGVAGAVAFAAVAGYGGRLVVGTVIASLAVFLNAVQHQTGIGLTAQLRQGWVSLADVARQVVSAAVIVALVAADGTLLDFLWANVVGGLAAVLIVVAVVRRTIPLRPTFDLPRWRALIADTIAFSAATAVAAVYFRLAMVLVSLIASEKQTGYYGAAFRGVEVILVVPALLVGAVFPIFARAARDDRVRLSYAVGRLTDALIIVGGGVALLLGTGAPTIIRIVAGPDFAPAADVLRIQGVGLFFSFVAAGVSFAALSMRLHRDVLVASLVALLACASFVSVLTALDDAVGASIGTTLSEVVLAGAMTRAMLKGGVRLAFDARAAARVAAALALALLPELLTGLPDSVRAALCLGVYGAALLALRAVPPELRELIPSRSAS